MRFKERARDRLRVAIPEILLEHGFEGGVEQRALAVHPAHVAVALEGHGPAARRPHGPGGQHVGELGR